MQKFRAECDVAIDVIHENIPVCIADGFRDVHVGVDVRSQAARVRMVTAVTAARRRAEFLNFAVGDGEEMRLVGFCGIDQALVGQLRVDAMTRRR